jgi:hypothetical protein
MAKWEYASIALVKGQKDAGVSTDKQVLDKYGLEGWELVAVVPALGDLIAYLKRQKM